MQQRKCTVKEKQQQFKRSRPCSQNCTGFNRRAHTRCWMTLWVAWCSSSRKDVTVSMHDINVKTRKLMMFWYGGWASSFSIFVQFSETTVRCFPAVFCEIFKTGWMISTLSWQYWISETLTATIDWRAEGEVSRFSGIHSHSRWYWCRRRCS